MNYLLERPEGRSVYNLEYVDWGSQSIVQSKFQRTASFLGKDVQENIRVLVRQYFSRKFPKKVFRMNALLSSLRVPHSRLARRDASKGLRKMQNAFSLSRSFSWLIWLKLYLFDVHVLMQHIFRTFTRKTSRRRWWISKRTLKKRSYLFYGYEVQMHPLSLCGTHEILRPIM